MLYTVHVPRILSHYVGALDIFVIGECIVLGLISKVILCHF